MIPVILVRTPVIKKIPPMNSARAIGNCISGGSPAVSTNQPYQLGSNFLILCTRKVAPKTARRPQWVMSCHFVSFRVASTNIERRIEVFNINIWPISFYFTTFLN